MLHMLTTPPEHGKLHVTPHLNTTLGIVNPSCMNDSLFSLLIQQQQALQVWQPQRAARSKRPNTPSDGSKHNGFQTTNQAVLIPKHVSRQDRAHDQEHHPLLHQLLWHGKQYKPFKSQLSQHDTAQAASAFCLPKNQLLSHPPNLHFCPQGVRFNQPIKTQNKLCQKVPQGEAGYDPWLTGVAQRHAGQPYGYIPYR